MANYSSKSFPLWPTC